MQVYSQSDCLTSRFV